MTKQNAQATDMWTIVAGLLGTALFLAAALFGYQYRGFAAVTFMASIGVAVWAHRKARKHALFWLAAIMLVVVHVALVVLLPWPTWKMGGPEFAPFAFLDFLATFAVMRLTAVAISRQSHEASTS
jgi:NADH:ubiquinone oxidoreductase subunit 3 (subunit A)